MGGFKRSIGMAEGMGVIKPVSAPPPLPAYGPTNAEVGQSGAFNAMSNNKRGRSATILTSSRGLGGSGAAGTKKTLLGN